MSRTLTALGATIGTLLVATAAQAADTGANGFGEQGQFIFGVDRLAPIFDYSQNTITDTNVNPNNSATVVGTSFGLLSTSNSVIAGGGGGAGAAATLLGGVPNFYTFPRVGFDYVIIPNLTLGGNIYAMFTLGGHTEGCVGNNCASVANPSAWAFGLAPRVGYIIGLSNLLAIWLRGGVSWHTEQISVPDTVAACGNRQDSDNYTFNEFGLDLDPQLVISPAQHFAFMVGPAFDWGFAGGANTDRPDATKCNTRDQTSDNYTSLNFGINAGLLGWF
jgi:hypothetical protein